MRSRKIKITEVTSNRIYQIIASKDRDFKDSIILKEYNTLDLARKKYINEIDEFKKSSQYGEEYIHFGIKLCIIGEDNNE